MSINQMFMMTQHHQYQERDPTLESIKLKELAHWAQNYTSDVVIYNDHTLLLELGRSLKLFGGARALLKRLHAQLSEFQFDVKFGFAKTPKAALLLSLNDAEQTLYSGQRNLLSTPLERLPINIKIIAKLQRCGFEVLDDIVGIPMHELGSRFGMEFVAYMEKLQGHIADPQTAIAPAKAFDHEVNFAEPISNTTWIEQQQVEMVQKLVDFAQNQQLIYENMIWSLKPEGVRQSVITTIDFNAKTIISQTKTQQIESLMALTKLRFETLKMAKAFTQLTLRCDHFTPINLYNRDLFNQASDNSDYPALRNRLAAKLGHRAVYQLETRNEHIPEHAYEKVEFSKQADNKVPPLNLAHPLNQPTWIYDQAKLLENRGNLPYLNGKLELIDGPNRVIHEWWRDLKSRDYYMAKEVNGRVVWIYFDRVKKRWFIQGLFG